MVFEVDMQPLAACVPGLTHGDRDHPAANAAAAVHESDDGVEQEGVRPPVPRHVHKTDQMPAQPSTDPTEAVAIEA